MGTQGKIRVYSREINTKEEREAVASGKKKKAAVTWSYCIEAGRDPSTGKRRRVTKHGFKSQREARAAAQPVLNKMMLGQNIVESDITFAEYADEWAKEYAIGKKQSSIKGTTAALVVWKKYFGKLKLKDISLQTCQLAINNYVKGRKNRTIRTQLVPLRLLFKAAVKYGHIRSNPLKEIVVPKQEQLPADITTKYLNKDELIDFLKVAKEYSCRKQTWFYPLCLTLAYTGMRIGEACALLWENINFEKRTIKIESTMYGQNIKDYKREKTPKTMSSIREIIISESLISTLKAWRVCQLERRLKKQKNFVHAVDNDYVFTRIFFNSEYPILQSVFQMACERLEKKGKLPKHIHAHMLRHTHASLLAETHQITLEEIQHRLGHSNDRITRQIYLHITEKRKHAIADEFEDYMKKATKRQQI